MKPTISIVIRCKNEEKYIGGVLTRIFEQVSQVPYEVVILDSGSTDRTLEIVRKFNIRLFEILSEKFNYSYALNYVIGLTQGEIICCLSAHCLPNNNQWLMELTEPILSGQAEATIGKQIPIKGMNPFEEVALLTLFPAKTPKKYSPHMSNANCSFLKKLWEENKFDEKIVMWEDFFWQSQLKHKYRFIYCPSATVYHSHPFTLKYWLKRSYFDGKAAQYIYQQTGFDITYGDLTSRKACLKHFLLTSYIAGRYFIRQKYPKMLFLLPVVKPLLFMAYLKGIREKTGMAGEKNQGEPIPLRGRGIQAGTKSDPADEG